MEPRHQSARRSRPRPARCDARASLRATTAAAALLTGGLPAALPGEPAGPQSPLDAEVAETSIVRSGEVSGRSTRGRRRISS